jgi:glycerol-3-phosphate acyltransferase PlsX
VSEVDLPVAVDALGGDHAPDVLVAAALKAARSGVLVRLVGDVSIPGRRRPNTLSILQRGTAFPADASPKTIRREPGTSIRLALREVAEGRASSVFSAGPTGATLVASVLELGVLPGVDRPAIASVLPRADGGRLVVVDSGANVDCRSEQLANFAVLGSVFSEVLGTSAPRVGLLSIGEEASKGNDQVRAAQLLLVEAPVHFVGNVEPTTALSGACDVVVCDGFVGNIFLKTVEATAETVLTIARRELGREPVAQVAAWLLQRRLRHLRTRLAWEATGGALLLGVKGVVVVGHGRTGPDAAAAGIQMAKRAVADGLVGALEQRLGRTLGH